jgi:hypothetical protein
MTGRGREVAVARRVVTSWKPARSNIGTVPVKAEAAGTRPPPVSTG